MKRDCRYYTTQTLKLAVYCSYTTEPCGENMLSHTDVPTNSHMFFFHSVALVYLSFQSIE